MFFIESNRLRLIPLTHQLLKICQTNRAEMELAVGLNLSSMQIDRLYQNEVADAMQHFWLPKTLEHPDLYQWYTSWEIVRKDTNTAIGEIGLIGYPNANGETEIGYMLDKQEHGKGYATEALIRLIKWAFTHEDVKYIIVHTYEDNLASRKLLLTCGFTEIGKDAGNLYTYRLNKV
jgi:ribosomal-protein-alanine N-acetyltransferase